MNDTFGMRLARLRSKNGMTQRDLGAAVGISWSQVSRYESGKARPRLPVLMKIADALGTDIESLNGDSSNEEGREITLMLSSAEEKTIEDFATKEGITFDQAVNQMIAAGMKNRMDKNPDLMSQLEAEIPGGYAKLLEMLGKKS